MRNRAPIFCFHNVVAEAPERGDASLHVPLPDFERYAEWIAATFSPVPLRVLTARLRQGLSVRGLASMTFDDAYRGVFRHAGPVLRRHGIPATVFVVTDASDHPAHFWWDVLAGAGVLDDDTRDHCIRTLQGDRSRSLSGFESISTSPLDPDLLPADWTELSGAGECFEFGSHSVSHRNLTALDPAPLDVELRESRRVLADRFPGHPEIVSYPYGCHDETVVRAAEAAGYGGGLVLEARTTAPSDPPLALPRVNVPAGISLEALECRAADLHFPR